MIVAIFSSKLRKFVIKRIFQKVDIKEKKDTIWIHCASVGEVNLAEPIIAKFLEETSNQIVLTMMTDTGRRTAEEKYQENIRIKILFFPLDDFFAIKKILRKIRLKKLILIETEIWPNLINLCAKKSSVAMINGRISDRSIKSYKRIIFILKKLFKNIDEFIMQTERDRRRIQILGASKNRVYNYGNLKFNIELPTYEKNELDELRNLLDTGEKKIFVAGSTRTGEEESLLKAFDKLEDTVLILVPRHIERTDDICKRLLDGKYQYEKWSSIEGQGKRKREKRKKEENERKQNRGIIHELPKKEVIIIDKIGELRKLYAICDVAYVGGTLVDVGGHSLLEPLFYRKLPIFGPHIQNIRDIAREVLARKIGIQVKSEEDLLKIIDNGSFSINNDDKIKNKIDKFFEENNHVVELTFDRIWKF